ncbi:hypothetical protein [Arthrobacter sp. TMS2-4]
MDDVLVGARVKARCVTPEGLHELPCLGRGEGFLQWDVQVATAAGRGVLNKGEAGGTEDACEASGVVVNDGFAGLGGVEVKAQCADRSVDVVQHDRRRLRGECSGDRQGSGGLRVLEPAILPPPKTVERLPRNQRCKDPYRITVGIVTARRGIKSWRCFKHSVYTFGRGYDLKRTHSVELLTGNLGGRHGVKLE